MIPPTWVPTAGRSLSVCVHPVVALGEGGEDIDWTGAGWGAGN